MNKFLTTAVLLFLSIPSLPTSEKGSKPFFQFSKSFKIKVDNKSNVICRVKLQDVLEYTEFKRMECFKLDRKLHSILKEGITTLHSKKELVFLFLDNSGNQILPELTAKEGNFYLRSIVYSIPDKLWYTELTGNDGKYYIYQFDLHSTEVRD